MAKELAEINAIYDRIHEDDSKSGQSIEVSESEKEQAEHELRQKRDVVLDMLRNGQIDQEQFSLLDTKISEYSTKLMGEKSTSS